MSQLNIPFNLGDNYELWEKDLECLPDRVKGYDSYLYLGNRFNKFLNYNTDRTELVFSWDVVEGIIISYNYLSLEDCARLAIKLDGLLDGFQFIAEQNYKLYKFDLSGKNLLLFYSNDTTYIIISNIITHSLYLSLLCCHF